MASGAATCGRTVHHACARGASACCLLMPFRTLLTRSHVLCTQAQGLAVNGSYAYVAAFGSNALVVVDVSNPASPVIRGSVVSSSLMNGVSDPDLRAWLASGTALASASSIVLAPVAPPPADALSRSHSLARVLALACCARSLRASP